MNTMDYSKFSPFNDREGKWLGSLPDSEDLLVGQSTMDRSDIASSAVSMVSGFLRLTHFTAVRDEPITQVDIFTGTTAASATPTLCRMGLYKVEDSGDLTLIASTANDTTLFAAASTKYTKSFTESNVTLEKGVRYAFGVLIVSAAAMPTMQGKNNVIAGIMAYPPLLATQVSGQADLPASVVAPASAITRIFAVLLP